MSDMAGRGGGLAPAQHERGGGRRRSVQHCCWDGDADGGGGLSGLLGQMAWAGPNEQRFGNYSKIFK
jgi:hypothetical protein